MSRIDAAIEEMLRRGKDCLPRLSIPNGDTLVYIDPPSNQSGYDTTMFKEIRLYFANPFRIRSEVLRATGSLYFEHLLGPTAQYRILRRLQHKLNGALPQGIKYVLDLTPPSEGDEAILSVQDLSCSRGVRLWGLSRSRWNISATLVGGIDEFPPRQPVQFEAEPIESETGPAPAGNITTEKSSPEPATQNDKSDPDQQERKQTDQKGLANLPDEYTTLRHRFAILRVLSALEGVDPKLDSAIKVWTTCAVAEKFQVKHPLTDYVVRWLRAPPNTYFTEVCPEVTLRMSEALQVPHLCRDTFALLVGEEALGMVYEGKDVDQTKFSVHGRIKEGFPGNGDDWVRRIQYSRDKFVERIKSEFNDLVEPESVGVTHMKWIDNIPETRKLWKFVKPDSQPATLTALEDLMTLLKSYVRGAIYSLLCGTFTEMPSAIEFRINGSKGGKELYPDENSKRMWAKLNRRERIFTRYFWDALSHVKLGGAYRNVSLKLIADYELAWAPTNELKELKETGITSEILLSDLERKVRAFNRVVHPVFSKVVETFASAQLDTVSSTSASGKSSAAAEATLQYPVHIHADASTSARGENTINLPVRPNAFAGVPLQWPFKGALESQTADLQLPFPHSSSVSTPLEPLQLATSKSGESDREGTRDVHPYSSLLQPSATEFSLDRFLCDVSQYLCDISRRMLAGPDVGKRDQMELSLTNTLCCLNDEELRYLPLWAEGYDDDTSGVYNDEVPFADTGFSTAGPSIHTGSMASSDFEMVDTSETMDTSTVVNDGYSEVGMDRRKVYDLESIEGDSTPVEQGEGWDDFWLDEEEVEGETESEEGNGDHIIYVPAEGEEDAMRP